MSLPTAEVRLVKPTTGGSVGLPDTPPPPILGGVCQPTADVRLIILAARGLRLRAWRLPRAPQVPQRGCLRLTTSLYWNSTWLEYTRQRNPAVCSRWAPRPLTRWIIIRIPIAVPRRVRVERNPERIRARLSRQGRGDQRVGGEVLFYVRMRHGGRGRDQGGRLGPSCLLQGPCWSRPNCTCCAGTQF